MSRQIQKRVRGCIASRNLGNNAMYFLFIRYLSIWSFQLNYARFPPNLVAIEPIPLLKEEDMGIAAVGVIEDEVIPEGIVEIPFSGRKFFADQMCWRLIMTAGTYMGGCTITSSSDPTSSSTSTISNTSCSGSTSSRNRHKAPKEAATGPTLTASAAAPAAIPAATPAATATARTTTGPAPAATVITATATV